LEDYLNEKEQWERVLAWLREQGPWMLVGVALVAAGWGGWQYWNGRIEQRELAAASRYAQILGAFSHNDITGGLRQADELIKEYPNTAYAQQANLAAARVQVDAKQLDQAAARLSQVTAATKDPELSLIARLRLARVQLAQGKPDLALQTLDAVNPGAFAARYADVRGDALLAKGDRDGALKEYRAARREGTSTLDTGLLDLKIDELARS
jgi:predicted negative regulator of RcsB-dependent stress response